MSADASRLIPADDVRLRRACDYVGRVNRGHRKFALDLAKVMNDACGIGIAAPQIGEMVRICIVLRSWEGVAQPIGLFDPYIVGWSKDEIESEEGCLSFPQQTVKVRRRKSVVVRHLRVSGTGTIETYFDGAEAICAQHEIDHLNGITMHMRAAA